MEARPHVEHSTTILSCSTQEPRSVECRIEVLAAGFKYPVTRASILGKVAWPA